MKPFPILIVAMALLAPSAATANPPHFGSDESSDGFADLSGERGQNDEPRKTLFEWNSDLPPVGGPPGWDEPLVSDRPDFTQASCTVGRGVAQLEMGYTFFSDRWSRFDARQHSFPETELRLGVFEWLEVDVFYDQLQERGFNMPLEDTIAGSLDLFVAAKLGLTQQKGVLPEMALLLQMTIPTGADGLTNDSVCPGINWLYGWDVSEYISVGASTQFNRAIDSVTSRPYLQFAQSVTIGYELTDRWNAFTEFFTLVASGADFEPTQSYFDGGFTFPLTNNLQLDIRAGVGLNAAAVDLFAGSGCAVRF